MASKRTAQWLDAQNFLYELNEAWVKEYEMCKKHEAENGKDATYYTMLGRSAGIADAKEMAERLINGEYRVDY